MNPNIPDLGHKALDFSLSTAEGESFSLSEAWSQSKLVLVFYRGHWCPFCVGQLRELAKRNRLYQSLGYRVVALSVDAPAQSQAFAAESKLPFDLLCDVNKSAVSLYHLHNHEEHGGIAYPAVFVIDSKGVIVFRSLDRTVRRLKLDELTAFLKQHSKDGKHLAHASGKLGFVPVTPKSMAQLASNMIRRGTVRDWKHYAEVSAFTVFRTLKKITVGKNPKNGNDA